VSVLASGSKGNSTYVATDRVRLLVDAGVSAREIERRLEAVGERPEALDAVVLTHEHTDHVYGLGALSRRYGVPVYLNRDTFRQLHGKVGTLRQREEFTTGRSFSIGDLTIHPFSVCHDAADPVGLTLETGRLKIGLCTDLGTATRLTHHYLSDCSILILEANHDPELLGSGPYPWNLKQRIRGRTGHLSNEESGELLARVSGDRLRQVILAHLSEINNSPERALAAIHRILGRSRLAEVRVALASQQHPLEPIDLC
jgi:phosphoribosyl 1,2-cyclic phosphodiesterase